MALPGLGTVPRSAYTPGMRTLPLLIAAAIVGGCNSEAAKPRTSRQERIDAAEIQVAKTPAPRTYRYQDGELRVLQVPVADEYGIVVQQPCFLWRDAEFRTASLQCVGESSLPALAGPENDRQRN